MARIYPEYKHLNTSGITKEIQQWWKENKIFEKSITSREGRETFTFYEGPPSANGLPGIHHVMGRAIKDIFCRFKTLEGFQVKRKAGWDTHGLPVELGVEKELGITKEDIGTKITVEEYNEACKKAVMRYTDVWNDLTEKMGYWVDMDDPYITYKPKYMESVWWLLKELWDKDLIYKGYTIQPYSPKAGTGLSSHELNMPGCYRDVKDTSAIAQFPAIRNEKFKTVFEGAVNEDDKVYFLAWTTTPWTLPSNTALTVGRSIVYVMVESFNQYTGIPQKVILAKNLVAKYFAEELKDKALSEYDGSGKNIPWKTVWEGLGEDLLELKYEQILPYAQPNENAENAFRVIPGDFVTTEDGTGIVHTAPTFGADDAKVARDAGVPPLLVLDDNDNPVPLVDLQGRFTKHMGEFAGKYVKNEYYADGEAPEKSVDVEISIKLKEENKAFKVEKYEHSYPHCWRTDKPVLYYPLDSWFIKVTAKKERLVELNKTINWKPKSTGEGRFGNWLENANDWNLSRSRYWGIPLPIWSTEDGTERKIFGSVEELKEACDEAVEHGLMEQHPLQDFEPGNMSEDNYNTVDLHRHIVDKIILKSSDGTPMHREADLIDVWFDSGAMPYAQWHYPFEELPGASNTVTERSPLTPEGGTGTNNTMDENAPDSPFGGRGAADNEKNENPSINHAAPNWQTANPRIYEELKRRSLELKLNETEAEKLLWGQIKGKKLGSKFRRQHIIEEFIVDFVSLKEKLIIEVDGKYHLPKNQRDADLKRMERLGNRGFSILRFTNDEILNDIESVLSEIEKTIELKRLKNESPLTPKGGTGTDNTMDENALNSPFGGRGAADKKGNTHPIAEGSPLTPEGGTGTDNTMDENAPDSPFGGRGAFSPIQNSSVFPADFIAEGVDQTRGWFYTLHTIAGLVFDSVAYKNVISNGLVLDKNGQKMSKRLGNAVDPFETIEKFGADPVRWYMLANAQPWDNLKFDVEGIAEVQRKFFGTLYNTYSFFALYANIDKFQWDRLNLTDVKDRPELDRWILSRLEILKKTVKQGYSEYEPTRAARAIQEFVDEELSNWYVRLCRRRFWKGEMSADKQMAYETLYDCLFTISQLMSPIAPFFAEWLYQNLTSSISKVEKELSVHLTYLSDARENLIDEHLNDRMEMAQRLSSMVFSLRKKELIKVRQPLQKMMVPALNDEKVSLIESIKDIVLSEVNVKELEIIRDTSGVVVKSIKPNFKKLGPKVGKLMKQVVAELSGLNQEDIQKLESDGKWILNMEGREIELTLDELEIHTQDIPGWLVMTENGITVALDINIDEDLKHEGIARELVNRIQNLRKDSGLEVTDRIDLQIQSSDEIKKAIEKNREYICSETLAKNLELKDSVNQGVEVSFDNIETRIHLVKV